MDDVKIKITLPSGYRYESVCTFREAEYRLYTAEERFTVAEGQLVTSVEQLVKVTANEKYTGKEFIEVTLTRIISGG